MKPHLRIAFLAAFILSLLTPVLAQGKPGVLTADQLKKVGASHLLLPRTIRLCSNAQCCRS